ncbi:4-hydroxyphenylacetate decarboxylase activase [Sporomusa sp.]|uniref:4-hydroxyphenylacetate decarboxylase activase n=1 Tax=Sporomusa sp. TaxID=2078658 RepID=UPI002BF58F67|nr:4-hydroxyphenylacetate decarboxylase activase [Sporomusa sp.]HWR44850.1 4-hydroxyphenylacetate decarboxylase activase [Sporomusa sp.]
MTKKEGLVFDIQSYSVHDGPGCRTTVFLAGCFLNCLWCANPESWDLKEKIMFAKSKCQYLNGCTRCVKACEKQGIGLDKAGSLAVDWQKCQHCSEFKCADACHTEALKICGRRYTPDELMRIINRDRNFWGPAGGVTFGGGEPFYQQAFLTEMVTRCKKANVHTAIETTAYVKTEEFLTTMDYIDFAFIDVKNMDSDRHREQTGVGNELIRHNIAALVKNGWQGRLVLRMPVIQGFNDSKENIIATASFMDELGLYEINILPLHRLGDSKWEQLGKTYAYKDYAATPQQKMEEVQSIFLDRKIACYVGSDTAF